jgi:hypothetical protein
MFRHPGVSPYLEKSIEEIIRDTPRYRPKQSALGASVEKAKPWALGAFKEILVRVVSESVKKIGLCAGI